MPISVLDMIESLQALDVSEQAADSIEDTREVLKDKQRGQLLRGERADGKKIGRYRSRKYAEAKHAINPLAGLGNVDLKLTGAVHKDIFVDVREDEFIIDSADRKMGKLIEKYGDPFGLNEESSQQYIDEALEENFVNRVKNKLGV